MNRLRALGALVALVGLIAGVPWLLIQYGAPMPSLDDLRDTWVSDTTLFAVLTAVLWLLWATFVLAVVNETIAVLRHVPAPRPAIALPLQRLAGALVGALILVGSVHTPSAGARAVPPPAAALAAPPAPDVERARPPVSTTVPSVASAPARTEPVRAGTATPHGDEQTVEVQRGDTAWGIAEQHLGDGLRWRDLWEINQGTIQPDGRRWADPQILLPGWRLRLPGQASESEAPSVHVVQEGESLWVIARDVLGDPALVDVLYGINRGVEQPDGGRLEDPDLIRPGWRLQLPNGSTPDASPPPAPTPDPPLPPPAPDPVPAPAPEEPAQPAPPPDPSGAPHVDDQDVPTEETDDSAVPLPILAGLGGGLVLVTALAVRMQRLRRRRAARGASILRQRLPAQAAATEATMTTAADVSLVRWAGQEIAHLVGNLSPRQVDGAPLVVELSEEAGIELLWSHPQPTAPAPWNATDGGWAWTLAYDPDAPVPPDDLPAGLPALVTIGQRDGRQLLVDLEAFGTVTVDGPPERVTAWLRALAVELSAGQDLSDAYVTLVGIDPHIDLRPRLQQMDTDDATRHIATALRQSTDALASSAHTSTFEARLGSTTPLDSTVVVAVADPDHDLLAIDISPRSGVAVVAGNRVGGRAHITLATDGTAHLAPLDLRFDAAQLPADVAGQVEQAFTSLDTTAPPEGRPDHDSDTELETPRVPPPADDEHRAELPSDIAVEIVRELADEHARSEDTVLDTEAPPLLVRVLGVPAMPDRPDLARRELIITTFLACRNGPVSASAVQDAVWGGKPVEPKTVWNIIGSTRRTLGDLPDGTPVMPAADRRQGTLSIADDVVTDLDLMRAYVTEAEDSSSARAAVLLRRALDLVQGPPFDGPGYDWAHRDQHVAEASTLIETSVERLVELALDAEDIDGAREAIVLGLRGLPGNEPLYRLRMTVEHASGNLAGVQAAYDELTTYLADLETEPSMATIELLDELLSKASTRRG